ncbi:MAG: thiamine phosphate synthase [Rhizobiaceae bacterium]|nr:thiamine phosphate synthase [Rhizobiaceae bacterium]
MTEQTIPKRCRLVLIAPPSTDTDALVSQIRSAVAGGDVASLIIPQYDMDEVFFQRHAEALTPIAQDAGAAVILSGETRIAARVGADGVHIEGSREVLDDAIDRLQDKMAVGAGGAKTRDDALILGEARPDYIFFGRFGYDTKPEPHPRNLTLGRWWAEMIEIPCIVMGGSDIESVRAVAETGAEFVALSQAIFNAVDPGEAVAKANAALDEQARQGAAT